MRKPLSMLIATGLAVLLFACFNTARADEWDKATKVTFGESVQVPGQLLPAGTYYFRLMDSQADRHIVQIFNEDHTKLITTILAIPNYRLQPADKTVLTYAERPAGEPAALQAWFYPGDNFGQEFVYPKSEAERLSQANNTKVPSTESEQAYPGKSAESASTNQGTMTSSTTTETNTSTSQATATSTQPSTDSSAAANAQQGSSYSPAPTSNTSAETSSTSQSMTETPARETTTQSDRSNSATSNTTSRDSLPQTGSLLPLVGLVGLVFLGAATLLRVAVRS